MVLRIISFLCISSLLGCAATPEKQYKSSLHLQIGTSHLEKGNYPLAIKELQESIELDEENVVAHNNLALALYMKHQFKSAAAHLEKAVQIAPKYTDAQNNLGRVYIELQRYDDAITVLNKASKDLTYVQPEKVYTHLGLAYFKMKNFGKAKATFLEALQINPTYCQAQNYYGQTLYQLNDFRNSSEALDKAIQVCTSKSELVDDGHYYGALSYLKLGQREKARARMQEVIRLYPESDFAKRAETFMKTTRE